MSILTRLFSRRGAPATPAVAVRDYLNTRFRYGHNYITTAADGEVRWIEQHVLQLDPRGSAVALRFDRADGMAFAVLSKRVRPAPAARLQIFHHVLVVEGGPQQLPEQDLRALFEAVYGTEDLDGEVDRLVAEAAMVDALSADKIFGSVRVGAN
jgi:hypothetical protein